MGKTYTTVIEITRDEEVDSDLRFAREQDEPGCAARYYAQQQVLAELGTGNLSGAFRVISCDLKSEKELAEDAAFDARFPTLKLWRDVDTDARVIREFIDFLREGYDVRDGLILACDTKKVVSCEAVIQSYFGVNGKKLNDEREALFDSIRKNPVEATILVHKDAPAKLKIHG